MTVTNPTTAVVELLRDIRDSQSVRKSERDVLYAIALRCDPLQGCAYYLNELRLADELGRHPESILKSIGRLETMNLLTSDRDDRGFGRLYVNSPLIRERAECSHTAELALWADPADETLKHVNLLWRPDQIHDPRTYTLVHRVLQARILDGKIAVLDAADMTFVPMVKQSLSMALGTHLRDFSYCGDDKFTWVWIELSARAIEALKGKYAEN